MKTLIIILLCITTFCISNAQDIDLIGTWNITEFAVISDEHIEKMTEDKLKEDGSVWDLFFKEGGKFKQTSNMSGTGTMDSQEGTWETTDENLTFVLQMNDSKIELNYTYELEEDILILKRSNPMGTVKIVSKFKKK